MCQWGNVIHTHTLHGIVPNNFTCILITSWNVTRMCVFVYLSILQLLKSGKIVAGEINCKRINVTNRSGHT